MTNKELEIRLINLENAFIQSQKNIISTIEQASDASADIKKITPYIDIEQAYIGDTSVTFSGVKSGHITAYCESGSGNVIATTITRQENIVTVSFEALSEVATVTISVI